MTIIQGRGEGTDGYPDRRNRIWCRHGKGTIISVAVRSRRSDSLARATHRIGAAFDPRNRHRAVLRSATGITWPGRRLPSRLRGGTTRTWILGTPCTFTFGRSAAAEARSKQA